MARPDEGDGGGTRSDRALRALERRLGYVFERSELLAQALTHPSKAHEDGDVTRGNERLEFLGDAVLDLLVSDRLMTEQPEAQEGVLSQARARAVNTQALAVQARRLGLDAWVRLGRGEERSGGREKPSILANVFEAMLGAVYLDGGLEAARVLVERELAPGGDDERDEGLADAKSRLQERLQARGDPLPTYATVEESGPPHAREFRVEVHLGQRVLAWGEGRSKRVAEQAAARRALSELERETGGAQEPAE